MADKEINFESKINELKKIVDTISDNALPLNESLKLYEDGQKIIKDLEMALQKAEEKVNEVLEIKNEN